MLISRKECVNFRVITSFKAKSGCKINFVYALAEEGKESNKILISEM